MTAHRVRDRRHHAGRRSDGVRASLRRADRRRDRRRRACYIGPCASLRGDFGRLEVRAGANMQDSCIMHGFPGTDTIVEEDGHIGHGAVLHGCIVQRNALVGMNAVVNDNAVIGESAMVAAMAFVKAGFVVPPRTLVAGVPGKIVRALTEQELAWKIEGTQSYQELTRRSLATMRATAPLDGGRAEPHAHRRRRASAAVGAQAKASRESPRPARSLCATRRTRSALPPRAARLRSRSSSRRPSSDTIPNSPLGDMVSYGRDIFVDTQRYAKQYVGNKLNCLNCHLDAGRLGELGAAVGRLRRVSRVPHEERAGQHVREAPRRLLPLLDERPRAAGGQRRHHRAHGVLVLARDRRAGRCASRGRGFPAVADPAAACERAARRSSVYATHCAACHQAQRRRYAGTRSRPCGAASRTTRAPACTRIATAAAFIKANMPLGQPNTLTRPGGVGRGGVHQQQAAARRSAPIEGGRETASRILLSACSWRAERSRTRQPMIFAPGEPGTIPGRHHASSRRPIRRTIPDSPARRDDPLRARRVRRHPALRKADYVGNGLNCVNCHLDDGRRPTRPRCGRVRRISAVPRVNQQVNTFTLMLEYCFRYSMNGTDAACRRARRHRASSAMRSGWPRAHPLARSSRVAAIAPCRSPHKPLDVDAATGVFASHCPMCHGANGAGLKAGDTWVFPAAMGNALLQRGRRACTRSPSPRRSSRRRCPIEQGKTLTDQQAWDVAAYINSKPRPRRPPGIARAHASARPWPARPSSRRRPRPRPAKPPAQRNRQRPQSRIASAC